MRPTNNRCPFVVKFAKFKSTRLMDEDSNFHDDIGVVEAKKKAENIGKDLVCFNEPTGDTLAFCKIMDFGKWQYSEKKKLKKNKSVKKTTKEMRFSPEISEHDVNHKMKQVVEFLSDGDDVMLTMRLKGRQRLHSREALERMEGIVAICGEHGGEVSRKVSSNLISIRVGKVTKKETK